MEHCMDTIMHTAKFLEKASEKTTSLPVSWSSGSLPDFTEEIDTYYFTD
jgi:hypothetical protein